MDDRTYNEIAEDFTDAMSEGLSNYIHQQKNSSMANYQNNNQGNNYYRRPNNNRSYSNSGGGGQYNQGGGNNYQGNTQGNNQGYKKQSGCTTGIGKNGKAYVRGWKYDKTHGLRSFIASVAVNSKSVVSKTGVKWMNVTVKCSHPNGTTLYNAMLQEMTDKVFIQDLGLMMNPKAPNGGYVGPFYRRKK